MCWGSEFGRREDWPVCRQKARQPTPACRVLAKEQPNTGLPSVGERATQHRPAECWRRSNPTPACRVLAKEQPNTGLPSVGERATQHRPAECWRKSNPTPACRVLARLPGSNFQRALEPRIWVDPGDKHRDDNRGWWSEMRTSGLGRIPARSGGDDDSRFDGMPAPSRRDGDPSDRPPVHGMTAPGDGGDADWG